MSDFPEFIRVRVRDSGTVQTIAKPAAVDPDLYEVLDEPATDSNGRALPPEFPAAPATPPSPYDALGVKELKAEVATRNEGRDEADQIPVAGKKPDLVAALLADDDNQKEH